MKITEKCENHRKVMKFMKNTRNHRKVMKSSRIPVLHSKPLYLALLLLYLALFTTVWPCITVFGPIYHCLALYYRVWPCITVLYPYPYPYPIPGTVHHARYTHHRTHYPGTTTPHPYPLHRCTAARPVSQRSTGVHQASFGLNPLGVLAHLKHGFCGFRCPIMNF